MAISNRKKNPLSFPLVMIEWQDHNSSDDWTTSEELKGMGLLTMHTVGWIVKEDADVYTIAGTYDMENGNSAMHMTIGKKLVTKKVILLK